MKGRATSVWRWAWLLASGVAVALVVIALLAVVGSNTSLAPAPTTTARDGGRLAKVFAKCNLWKVDLSLAVLPVGASAFSGESSPLESAPMWRAAMMQRSDSMVIYKCIELGRPWPIATSQPSSIPADGSWTSITPHWYHFGPLSIEWPGYVYWPGLLAWIGVITAAWMLAWVAATIARRRIRRARGQCVDCGYSLAGISGERCPECGSIVAHDR
ncbi:MAG: hypothetical protein IT434_01540 [Phycisphaerales bacterium]|jgi:hypothetical protein|nr:hypothetical protein [Phycisphaerales bacterium]